MVALAEPAHRHPAVRHGRLGRRRQEHADRPAALRLQVDLRGPARRGRADQPGPGRGLHQPGPAHRRAAGRARAGHHHRRRLPLLRDAAAQVHHRRHPRPHPVHPQHGHRRVHRRPRDRPGGRPQRADRADPAARVPRHAAAGAAPGARGEQDGPGRLRGQEVFEKICEEFSAFATKLDIGDLTFIPISALHGDNVVDRSANMPWYDGPLAAAPPGARAHRVGPQPDRRAVPGAVRHPAARRHRRRAARLPRLRRPGGRRRAQAGRRGAAPAVRDCPPGSAGSTPPGREIAEAFAPMSVTLLLDDDVDISRGDMICRPHNRPAAAQDIEAMVCWMSSRPAAGAAQPAGRQAHHAHGEGDRPRPALPAST